MIGISFILNIIGNVIRRDRHVHLKCQKKISDLDRLFFSRYDISMISRCDLEKVKKIDNLYKMFYKW